MGGIPQEFAYTAIPPISALEIAPHRGEAGWVTIQVPAKFCYCSVISNCCDLEPRGGRVRTHAFSLARLRTISDDLRRDADRFNSLAANKDPRDPKAPGYIDYFYMEPHPLLEAHDWSVHFNQIVTLPTSDIELLLQRKILQLDDRTRMKFKIKLAFTIGRPNQEELAAGLENPWHGPGLGPAGEE
jgi:hypothetical protein